MCHSDLRTSYKIILGFYHFVMSGRFLAEVTKEVLSDLEASKYQVEPSNLSTFAYIRTFASVVLMWCIGVFSFEISKASPP